PLTESSCLPSCSSVTLYFPGSIPREKYSPFLLVFSVYLRPLSVLYHSTVAPAMGLPCISLATPLTVPVAWAKAAGMHRAAGIAIITSTTERFFMFGLQNEYRSEERRVGTVQKS